MNELKNDLKKFKITFDKTVLITDLVNEYKSTAEEISEVVKEFVEQQESKGTKFSKRFLVSGAIKSNKKTVFSLVESEEVLKAWLQKLENAESTLYSLQIDGGAKRFEHAFKPAQFHAITMPSLETRPALSYCSANGSGPDVKTEPKTEIKKGNNIANAFAKKTATETKASPAPVASPKSKQKASPETKKVTPEEKKPVAKTSSSAKKGINSFFAPADKKADSSKATASGVIKPPTPKKMQDFFKKQTEKPVKKEPVKDIKKEAAAANTSMQLFDDAEDEEEAESSDEEEQLDALKRDLISSDHEMDTEENEKDATSSSTSVKRRRIVDSDEEDEEPQKKKKDKEEDDNVETEEEEPVPQSETYLDEDGFVITIKNKNANKLIKKPTSKVSPPKSKPLRKSPIKASSAASTSNARTKAATSKAKQGNIMSFFNKK